jgi:chromosome segregation ATPase
MSMRLEGDGLMERVESLAAWINDLDGQVRAAAVTTDAKTLKELAKALDAWSKHDPKLEQRITNRVDVLADRFATLAGTVNATATALAGKDGEIAQLRRELEDGTARIEAVVRELRQSGTGSDVADLRKAVAALAAQRSTGAGEGRVGAVASDVDVLAQRLDTLSKTVSTTAAGLAGKEGELAALRARLEEGDARAESVIAELRASVAELSLHVGGLSDQPRDPQTVRVFENHLLDLS